MSNTLYQLSIANLQAIASSLKTGILSQAISTPAIEQILGYKEDSISEYFGILENSGFTKIQIATLVETIIKTKANTPAPENVFELVLSGPEVPGVHTSDTSATMRSMIEEAGNSVFLVGYAVHNVKPLFEPIADKLDKISGFNVTFCLDISRSLNDTSLESEIIRRFAKEFKEKHWPWPLLPKLFYDPRSLDSNIKNGHSSLHAKCIISDRKVALVTSANFTDAAQFRNIEAGIFIKHQPMVNRLAEYFERLIEKGFLKTCSLL
jgi:phosphatidylserine/phosphatidylglycerophosphate/cardiolipin synthase-like enzyme